MVLPGLFIEHIVVGAMALLWFLPLAVPDLMTAGSIPLGQAAALAPAVYVLGMLVDVAAFYVTSRLPFLRKTGSLKWCVRRYVDAQSDLADTVARETAAHGRGASVDIYLSLRSADLVAQTRMRSSRDRIARSTILNVALIWALAGDIYGLELWMWLSICILSVLVWAFLEAESYKFENRAVKAVDDAGLQPGGTGA